MSQDKYKPSVFVKTIKCNDTILSIIFRNFSFLYCLILCIYLFHIYVNNEQIFNLGIKNFCAFHVLLLVYNIIVQNK